MNWSNYSSFKKSEFDCSHTGKNEMQPEFMGKLQELRDRLGKPMIIISGYRAPEHPVEARKSSPGWHSKGAACDVACWSDDAFHIVKIALELGFTGIGVNQSGASGRFVHLDMRDTSPVLYSY